MPVFFLLGMLQIMQKTEQSRDYYIIDIKQICHFYPIL